MSEEESGVSDNQKWAFIFHALGEENLREMLFRAAIRADEEDRVVVEFTGERAMDVTDHYEQMEDEITE